MTDGFFLDLQEYCSYCGEFNPDAEKIECTQLGEEADAYITMIRCRNAYKCSRIAENLKRKI